MRLALTLALQLCVEQANPPQAAATAANSDATAAVIDMNV